MTLSEFGEGIDIALYFVHRTGFLQKALLKKNTSETYYIDGMVTWKQASINFTKNSGYVFKEEDSLDKGDERCAPYFKMKLIAYFGKSTS